MAVFRGLVFIQSRRWQHHSLALRPFRRTSPLGGGRCVRAPPPLQTSRRRPNYTYTPRALRLHLRPPSRLRQPSHLRQPTTQECTPRVACLWPTARSAPHRLSSLPLTLGNHHLGQPPPRASRHARSPPWQPRLDRCPLAHRCHRWRALRLQHHQVCGRRLMLPRVRGARAPRQRLLSSGVAQTLQRLPARSNTERGNARRAEVNLPRNTRAVVSRARLPFLQWSLPLKPRLHPRRRRLLMTRQRNLAVCPLLEIWRRQCQSTLRFPVPKHRRRSQTS